MPKQYSLPTLVRIFFLILGFATAGGQYSLQFEDLKGLDSVFTSCLLFSQIGPVFWFLPQLEGIWPSIISFLGPKILRILVRNRRFNWQFAATGRNGEQIQLFGLFA